MLTKSWADDPKNLYVNALRVAANLPARKREQFLELARLVEWERRNRVNAGETCGARGCLDERLMEHETGGITCPLHAASHSEQPISYRGAREDKSERSSNREADRGVV
jgi:hypothetical protein